MTRSHTSSSALEVPIAVVAPRFPAINQSWIDTYLEQLLKHQFMPVIFTLNRTPTEYAEKVDLLNLRQKTVLFPNNSVEIFKSFIRSPRAFRFFLEGLSVALQFTSSFADRIKQAMFYSWLRGSERKSNGVSITHSHSEALAFTFLPYCVGRRVPLVLTFHGLPPAGVKHLGDVERRILYSKVNRVVVNTLFAKKQVCALGCDPKKITILPQGLPLDEFPFHYHAFPEKGQRLKLLTVGRYHRDKGQHYALLALKRLVGYGVDAEYTFVGVGEGRSRLESLAAQLGLSDRVKFVSGISAKDLKALYQSHHLFVLPSIDTPGGHVETQGVVLQEAQASGCIPIATKTGGIPECLNDGEDAKLVKQQSSREIFEAVLWFYSNPNAWSRFQDAGRRNVEQNYSADVIGRKMSELLQQTISQNG